MFSFIKYFLITNPVWLPHQIVFAVWFYKLHRSRTKRKCVAGLRPHEMIEIMKEMTDFQNILVEVFTLYCFVFFFAKI